jgi:hypothetical protein
VGPKQCTFNLIQFEGRWTQNAITIQAVRNCCSSTSIPLGHGHGYNPPANYQPRGIWIWAGVRHVRFIGGWCNNYSDYPYGSVAIEFANGAKDIRFDNVGISQPFAYGIKST